MTAVATAGARTAVGSGVLRGLALVPELPPRPRTQLARISYDDPSSLTTAFTGASAVIHLAGILVERPGSTYQMANVQTTRAVVEAAEECAVDKLVFVSAVGADATPSLDDVRVGVGLGIRYRTAIGPLRADIAVPLNREPGDSGYGIYVGLGQAF